MRVLLIGVDGLTLRIVKPLMAQGLLPHLRQIYEGGTHALLQAPLPPAAITRWQAIVTGLPPKRQGLIPGYDGCDRCLLQVVASPPVSLSSRHQEQEDEPLWNLLSAWGRRVIVANVPATYPPCPINGIMLSGPPAPAFYAGLTYPPDFAVRLLEVIPDYQLMPTWRGVASWFREPLAEIRRLLEERRALLNLLLREAWDCCLFVLQEIDLLQHLYWDRILDLHSDVVACYVLLDELLGQALAALQPSDLLILLSPYSFQSIKRTFHLKEYLMRYTGEFLSPKAGNPSSQGVAGAGNWRGIDPWRVCGLRLLSQRLLPLPARRRWRAAHLDGSLAEQEPAGPVLANRPFSLMPASSPLGGYASIALADYLTERHIEDLIADLQAQVDPVTAYPAIGDIYREEACATGGTSALPAKPRRRLMLLAHDGVLLSQATGRRHVWSAGTPYCGMHHPDGLLCLYGAGLARAVLKPVSAYDIVPTVLTALKVPVPAHLSGRLLLGSGAPLASPSSI
ncbi:alkaline phosphatase family protein [Thermogemmatispora sp.]|uniref:alkaline phosphatase family protein n=1 Tax=Thermogemmatispora sp. TaxID=1968838 RepID=UPI001D1F0A18|nr:alkaline phosphatase family protein [Thermogemmatispora sp.]MBX5450931.1 alkaline phosphatase family protein [Thermogemmatispora sp.]